jgi:hypothetical protein
MKKYRDTTLCENVMDQEEASRLIAEADARDHADRSERLLELAALLPDDDIIGFSGEAAPLLFEDVKATGIYACFTSTVLTAHAFCLVQLAGLLRLLPGNPNLPPEATSLEDLAAMAVDTGTIDVELQARLLTLHDLYRSYAGAQLHEDERRFERHRSDAESVTNEDPLLVDARLAVDCAIRLIYRR